MAAWDKNYSVLIGTLHTDATTIAWALGLRNLQGPIVDVLPVAGMPYDMGRNAINMAALDAGVTHVLHLDSDVIPPSDAIPRLLAHDLPVVSGMYCRRSPPHALPVMMKNGQWVTGFKPGAMVEADVVGAGCLLIRRDVLQNFPPIRPGKHWFSWQVDLRGTGTVPEHECMSEDYTFCFHCRNKLGIKIMVDTSVVCRHIGNAEATYNSFLPLNTTSRT